MKIIQIGFNKCGTRTLHHFFQENGLRCIHWDRGRLASRIFWNLQNGKPLLDGYESFDVFTDMELLTNQVHLEAFKLFPYFAKEITDATFILNTRDRDSWIRSRVNHGSGNIVHRQMKVLGLKSTQAVIEFWTQDWERHHHRVRQFFANEAFRFFPFNIDRDGPELLQANLPSLQLDCSKYKRLGRTSSELRESSPRRDSLTSL